MVDPYPNLSALDNVIRNNIVELNYLTLCFLSKEHNVMQTINIMQQRLFEM